MKAKALPVTSFEDATLDFEQVQVFLTSGDITSDSTGRLARVSKLNGTTIPLAASWTAPTLVNSWANQAGFETAGYMKDPLGFVHLKGVIVSGTSGTVAFTLPAGFRPGARTNHPLGAATTTAAAQTLTTGDVTIFLAAAVAVGLSGVSFLAEN